jgi:hypothetical protein
VSDLICPVCKRDVEDFESVYQIYLTKPTAYTDCMRQTVVCTPCIGEFGETPDKYIEFQNE